MSSQKNRAILIQEKLERHFLHGLACEWECAQEFLNAQNKVKLRKPSEKKEICLNRDLLYNHTWGAVREILIHEMAHQFAEQALGGHDEPPHGPKCKGGRP
jgi:hypothetical protein